MNAHHWLIKLDPVNRATVASVQKPHFPFDKPDSGNHKRDGSQVYEYAVPNSEIQEQVFRVIPVIKFLNCLCSLHVQV